MSKVALFQLRAENLPVKQPGFVFRGGSVTGTGQVYLGRSYRAYSRVILIGTWFFPLSSLLQDGKNGSSRDKSELSWLMRLEFKRGEHKG